MNGGMVLCGLGFHRWVAGTAALFDSRLGVEHCARCYEERQRKCECCGGLWPASAMSAREGQDRETGLEAKPASAVGNAETPSTSRRSTGE